MKELRPYQIKAIDECWKELKESDDPVLLMASVGSGKSLMLASILLKMQKLNKRALCLVNNAELVQNNCTTLLDMGGEASIYCASLNSKADSAPIIFGTPQTVLNGIRKNETIAKIKFNLIVVDEAHAINYVNNKSGFMRILRHYKQLYPEMRLLGATGTNYRYKGASIVGEGCLFKKQTGNITTEYLISEGYLVSPLFEVDRRLVIDFSNVKIKQNGLFDARQLEQVISENMRLTELICKQLVHIMQMQNRFGVFIFATTRRHAEEILCYLPINESALILGDTPQEERTIILNEARKGKIKYLVNIAIISVGVDVPAYDTIAYLRPTESLVLLVQTMGRALRLSEKTNKKSALILDFAGNIERHSHWDNPILLKALEQIEEPDRPRPIICPKCQMMNTDTARRCVGLSSDNVRCDYYFEFKLCFNDKCGEKNDISARHCHTCKQELIDPNAKLTLEKVNKKAGCKEYIVISANYSISDSTNGFRINCLYRCADEYGKKNVFFESYKPISEKAKNVFYGNFIKKHCDKPSQWYLHIFTRSKMEQMLIQAKTPDSLVIEFGKDKYRIKTKIFN